MGTRRESVAAWAQFLDQILFDAPGAQVQQCLRLWKHIVPHLQRGARFPGLVALDNGQISFTWSLRDRYLDVEIDKNGAVEWFFRTPTGGVGGTADEPETGLPLAALTQILESWLR